MQGERLQTRGQEAMATVQVLMTRARAAESRQGNGEVQTQINKDAILLSSPGIVFKPESQHEH